MATEASLRCWAANGIPIMVMASKRAKIRWVNAIHIPPSNIHKMFISVLTQPDARSLKIASLPKGQSAREASFKVCKPNGIPIMVIISSRLANTYSTAIKKPPKTSQTIFPKTLIRLNLLVYL